MRRRILLADDSVTIQKVIELTFMDEDYDVKAVSNGDEALAALPDLKPDVVIADVHMPGANGYEVCRRSKEVRPEVPVLLLVGTFEPFDEAQSRAVGADSFLKKPFDSQELLQRVEELLAAKAAPAAGPEPSAAAAPEPPPLPQTADWGSSFQLEPSPAPPAAEPFPPPIPFPQEEDHPFASIGESAFEEHPFTLEEEPDSLQVDESTLMPAGEPLFELDATADLRLESDLPSFDQAPAPPAAETRRIDAGIFQDYGFAATPEERLGVPQGAAPLVESRAETEARIEAPPPPSIEESHEPESTAPATPPPAASPVPPAPPLAVGSAVPASANGGGALSDEDVDRIARRVVELMADRAIRDVAWEVIPDMAEMVIRDRLRELESQAESFE